MDSGSILQSSSWTVRTAKLCPYAEFGCRFQGIIGLADHLERAVDQHIELLHRAYQSDDDDDMMMMIECGEIIDCREKLVEIEEILKIRFPGMKFREIVPRLKECLGLEQKDEEEEEEEEYSERELFEFFKFRDPDLETGFGEFKNEGFQRKNLYEKRLIALKKESLDPFKQAWERKSQKSLQQVRRNILKPWKEKKDKGQKMTGSEAKEMLQKLERWDKKLYQKIINVYASSHTSS
jgi:hypothetical protein